MSSTPTTASATQGDRAVAATPARARVTITSSGAYPTDDRASEAKTGRAIRLGRRVSPRAPLGTGRPTRSRLTRSAKSRTNPNAMPALGIGQE